MVARDSSPQKAIIGGTLSHSLNDVVGEVSYVIWFCGCNFRCPFCQNFPMVINDPTYCEERNIDDILETIREVKPYITYVQVTGGEPTLQKLALDYLYRKVKDIGLNTSLDTNGSMPNVINTLISSKLLDHLAMDVKAPLNARTYSKVIGLPIQVAEKYVENIRKSLKLASQLDFVEIRTTFVPSLLTEDDLISIAKELSNYLTRKRHFYVLQQFVPNDNAPDPKFRQGELIPLEKLRKLAREILQYLPNIAIRHINGVDYL